MHKKVIIKDEPFISDNPVWALRSILPASWICHPQHQHDMPFVVAYSRKFSVDSAQTMRIHVSADERFELFCDGERIGRGPERGMAQFWYYQSYDLDLTAGDHLLVARCWSMGNDAPAPYAQLFVQPGFLLCAQDTDPKLLNTGEAPWKCKKMGGYTFLNPDMMWGTGAKICIDAADFEWGFQNNDGSTWDDAVVIRPAVSACKANEYHPSWLMTPSILPAMLEDTLHVGTARHIENLESEDTKKLTVESRNNKTDKVGEWNSLLTGKSSLTIPANTMMRAIIDLNNYYCAFPQLTTSGGKGAKIRIHWAESLFTGNELIEHLQWEKPVKKNRNEIEGKYFDGMGDIFLPDGGKSRVFDTLWWEAGRYLEFFVSTGDEPLEMDDFCIRETHYPYTLDYQFNCDNPGFESVKPIATRVLEMCSHETYMDCPYYEQLMYVGDTRLEVLTTYAITRDDSLPKKALVTFDRSRLLSGITQSRFPCRITQIIPPFSLWWVSMVHDFSMWRNDMDFVASLMPGVRAVLDCYWGWVNKDGLVEGPNGWNFMDWVNGWVNGIPPEGDHGISSVINWHFVYALKLASELETMLGEPELAARQSRRAERLAKVCERVFWDEEGGLLANDLAKTSYSEHTQCLALLSDLISEDKAAKCAEALLTREDLDRTTIYFTHYLFETYKKMGRIDKLIERLGMWFDLESQGFKTTPEEPEPSRSDCHAWGAHPLYHYMASILGIRPIAPGFTEVEIAPQLGHLNNASGVLPHPNGEIKVNITKENGQLRAQVEIPEGVSGIFKANGKEIKLASGISNI